MNQLSFFSLIDASIDTIELPPPETTHWVAQRKLAVIEGIRRNLISREKALSVYHLSEGELQEWETAFIQDGKAGLRITKRRKR